MAAKFMSVLFIVGYAGAVPTFVEVLVQFFLHGVRFADSDVEPNIPDDKVQHIFVVALNTHSPRIPIGLDAEAEDCDPKIFNSQDNLGDFLLGTNFRESVVAKDDTLCRISTASFLDFIRTSMFVESVLLNVLRCSLACRVVAVIGLQAVESSFLSLGQSVLLGCHVCFLPASS